MGNESRRALIQRISTLGAAGALLVAGSEPAAPQSGSDGTYALSAAERAAGVGPVRLQFAPGDVRRYGADPSGSQDSTQAFIDANSVGRRGGGVVRIPSGQYKYVPSVPLDLTVSWLGDGPRETVILCDNSKFQDEFFRIVGSTEMRDMVIKATGPKAGTGVRLAPADAGQFTGHVRLTRLWVFGFNYNIQCDNNFEVTFDQVRAMLGNEGFYCAPDVSLGNGYATSHLHLNCYYAQNTRNVLYSPSIRYAFRTITFVGGAIEGATGGSSQASFTRCSPLKFIQIYLEAAPKIPALVLDDCIASIDGAYLGGTGGIRVGTHTRITLMQVTCMTASDVFSGGDGTQRVIMQDCLWPASGNSLAVASLALRNTSINGVTYPECAPEISSLGATRFDRQTTLVTLDGAQDVYRFLGVTREIHGGSISGRFEIIAKDKGDITNQTLYECWVGSASGGAKHASLVIQQRLVRGTDVGASATPLSLADDGGGVKLQFQKNPGIIRAAVDVLFYGIVSAGFEA
jgi:hypothetical protein